MKAVIAHLAKVNKKIQSYDSSDTGNVEKLEVWICNDFMWTIMDEPKTKSFFEERFYYFDRLIQDKKYQDLQNALIDTIQDIGSFLNKKQIIEATYARQKSFRDPFDGDELFVDLKILVNKIFSRESYLALGDHTSFMASEEISIRVHSYPIRRQYEAIQVILRYIANVYCEYATDEDINDVAKSLGKLNDLEKQLILLLKTYPERLHVKAFETLHSEYAHIAPDSLTPGSYGFALDNKHPKLIKRLQECVQIIFDDIELHSSILSESVKKEPSNQVGSEADLTEDVIDNKNVCKDLILTDDGKLLYEGFEPIFDLPSLHKDLWKQLFTRERDYNHKTIDIETAVYGDESTKQTQDKLRKLVERVNKLLKNKFDIPEAIHYGINDIRRLV